MSVYGREVVDPKCPLGLSDQLNAQEGEYTNETKKDKREFRC